MLILNRRTGEVLYIGDGERRVKVEVLGVRGNQVRIGITAPRAMAVHREEVWVRIQEERAVGSAEESEINGNR